MSYAAPLPANEGERLAALRSYGVLDTPHEESFDRLTRLVAAVCDAPIALVSLIDEHRQWFKSKIGVDACETPRDKSFCAHVILRATPLLIPDTSVDPRFSDHPLVLGPPYIRAYAGAPLVTPEGHRLGTLCAIHTEPTLLSPTQVDALVDLSAVVVDELVLHRLRHQKTHDERVRRFVEESPAAMALLNMEMRYVAASDRWRRDHGLDGVELTGKSHYDVFPDIPENWRNVHAACLAGATRTREIDRYDRPDGSTMWLRWDIKPWTDEFGQTAGLVILHQDLTPIVNALARLGADERAIAAALEVDAEAFASLRRAA